MRDEWLEDERCGATPHRLLERANGPRIIARAYDSFVPHIRNRVLKAHLLDARSGRGRRQPQARHEGEARLVLPGEYGRGVAERGLLAHDHRAAPPPRACEPRAAHAG